MKTILLLISLSVFANNLYAVNPERGYKSKPSAYNIPFEEKKIRTNDQFGINMWIYEPNNLQSKKMTVVMVQGDGGNMSYLIFLAHYLSQEGYRVITFDYRGFGESADFNTRRDVLYYDEFVTDLETVLIDVKRDYPNDKLGLCAMSMGSIISFFTINRTNIKIDFLISEGTIVNCKDVAYRIHENKSRDVTYPKSAEELEHIIKETQIPMLIFSGNLDKTTTIEDSRKIVAERSNRKLIEFSGNHLEGLTVLKNEYIVSISEFIKSLNLK